MQLKDMISWAKTHVYEGAEAEAVAGLLWRLDRRLLRDVIRPREGGERVPEIPAYSAEHQEQVLLLGAPDDEVYRAYIEYHICRTLGEVRRANDAYALYLELLADWKRAYMSTHAARPVRFSY